MDLAPDNIYAFTNLYNKWADLSMSSGVITQLPSVDDCFSAVNGRNVEDQTGRDTIALFPDINTGSGTGVYNGFNAEQEVSGQYPNPNASTLGQVPPGFHRNYCVKYDYSSYEFLHPAHGMFGPKYGLWVVFTAGHDTFVFGPDKQNLDFTGGILTIEAMSGHYQTGYAGISYSKGTVLTNRIFGPYYVRINHFGMIPTLISMAAIFRHPPICITTPWKLARASPNFYNSEPRQVVNGYIPTNARGSVSVQVNGVAGSPRTAWAVLSQPGANHIFGELTPNYTIDISANRSGTFTNVVPGQLPPFRIPVRPVRRVSDDSIVVAANQTTTVPT